MSPVRRRQFLIAAGVLIIAALAAETQPELTKRVKRSQEMDMDASRFFSTGVSLREGGSGQAGKVKGEASRSDGIDVPKWKF